MARAFYDNFDRADGPLGPDWSVQSGTWAINANRAACSGAGFIRPVTQPSGDNACQRIWVVPPTSGTKSFQLLFRGDATLQSYKFVEFVVGTSTVIVTLRRRIAGVYGTYATVTFGQYSAGNVDLMASVSGDQLLGFVNGYQVAAAQDAQLPDNGIAQVYAGGTAHYIDEYDLYDTGGAPFTASVVPLEDPAGSYEITLTNGGADWTPGTPGAPEFSAGAGTIASQEVTDANTAVLVYTPPTLDAQTVLYDPQNDFYFQLGLSTSLAGVGGGGSGGGLTTAQSGILTDLAALIAQINDVPQTSSDFWLQLGAITLMMHAGYTPSGDGALGAMLDTLLGATGDLPVTAARVHALLDLLNATTDSGNWTLQYVWGQVKGDDNRDLTTIYNQIAALASSQGTDLTDLMNAILAIRTANLWTLGHVKDWIDAIPAGSNTDVLNELAVIRTANFWTLGHVMDALGAIPTDPIRSLQPDLDAIAAVRGSGNPDLADVLTAIGGLPAPANVAILAAIAAAVVALAGDIAASQTAVIAEVAASLMATTQELGVLNGKLDTLLARAPVPQPPVWPGLAKVTLGMPHAITTGLTITTPMHGVILAITGAPTKQGYFTFDDARSWRNTGSLSFFDDQGHQEFPQHLGFTSAVYVPKAMAQAAGIKVRAVAGATGTVTPWTINTV